jgi:hypothetical protein
MQISTWTFLATEAPNCAFRRDPGRTELKAPRADPTGNGLNCAAAAGIVIAVLGVMFWIRRENAAREAGKRDHRLEGLSEDDLHRLGHRHAAFRYRY